MEETALRTRKPVVVVGGGLTGLSAAYELTRSGRWAILLEADDRVGGLARSFEVEGGQLDRFYHHWFRSDRHAIGLVEELGLAPDLLWSRTRTGLYYNSSPFRLSTPIDVLRFTPLSLLDRIRLGGLVLRAKAIRDWRSLESLTAREWIERVAGERVYGTVWEPLLVGKFGEAADRIGAVWFWSKLALRGGSRARDGAEELGYLRGGFQRLAEALARAIGEGGGEVRTGCRAISVGRDPEEGLALRTSAGSLAAEAIVLATPLPVAIGLARDAMSPESLHRMESIDHLANVCVVLELDRSLSSTYWLNVNDPSFPFVGVIEHTAFQPTSEYGGRHLVYLSRYLPASDPVWAMDDPAVLAYTVPHLVRMFPEFEQDWIMRAHVWRAEHAQPIVPPDYSRILPTFRTEVPGLYMATMAHIYPEDRGTNYAIRDGRSVARLIMRDGVARPVAGA